MVTFQAYFWPMDFFLVMLYVLLYWQIMTSSLKRSKIQIFHCASPEIQNPDFCIGQLHAIPGF